MLKIDHWYYNFLRWHIILLLFLTIIFIVISGFQSVVHAQNNPGDYTDHVGWSYCRNGARVPQYCTAEWCLEKDPSGTTLTNYPFCDTNSSAGQACTTEKDCPRDILCRQSFEDTTSPTFTCSGFTRCVNNRCVSYYTSNDLQWAGNTGPFGNSAGDKIKYQTNLEGGCRNRGRDPDNVVRYSHIARPWYTIEKYDDVYCEDVAGQGKFIANLYFKKEQVDGTFNSLSFFIHDVDRGFPDVPLEQPGLPSTTRRCRNGLPNNNELWNGVGCGTFYDTLAVSSSNFRNVNTASFGSGNVRFDASTIQRGKYMVKIRLGGVDTSSSGVPNSDNWPKPCTILVDQAGWNFPAALGLGNNYGNENISGLPRTDDDCTAQYGSHYITNISSSWSDGSGGDARFTINFRVVRRPGWGDGGRRVNVGTTMWYMQPIIDEPARRGELSSVLVADTVCADPVGQSACVPGGSASRSANGMDIVRDAWITPATIVNTLVDNDFTYVGEPGTKKYIGVPNRWYLYGIVGANGSSEGGGTCQKQGHFAVKCVPKNNNRITGSVFRDDNWNGTNSGTPPFTPSIRIIKRGGGYDQTFNGASYNATNLSDGTYDVFWQNVPAGWFVTGMGNPPPEGPITVAHGDPDGPSRPAVSPGIFVSGAAVVAANFYTASIPTATMSPLNGNCSVNWPYVPDSCNTVVNYRINNVPAPYAQIHRAPWPHPAGEPVIPIGNPSLNVDTGFTDTIHYNSVTIGGITYPNGYNNNYWVWVTNLAPYYPNSTLASATRNAILGPVPNLDPIGYLEGASCTNFNGWTCDANDFNASLQVHFYRDGPAGGGGTFVGSTTANVPREPGVQAACGGAAGIPGNHPNHGFSYTLDPAIPLHAPLFNGSPHRIYAHAINTPPGNNPALFGSGSPAPVGTITCTLPKMTGNLYWDSNNNGILDVSEQVASNAYDDSNLPGRVTVTVSGGTSFSGTSTLPPNPSYTVSGIFPGTYNVSVTTPAGYRPTVLPPPTTISISSDVTKHIAIRGYQISGRVCVDNNLNGACEAAEPLYTGSTSLTVPTTAGLGARSTTTNTGPPPPGTNYILRNFRGGGVSYNVSLAVPAGYVLTGTQTNPKSTTITTSDRTIDFAIAPIWNITANIAVDNGAGCIVPPSLPLGGINVTLNRIPAGFSQTGSANPTYIFTNIPQNNYLLTVSTTGPYIDYRVVGVTVVGGPPPAESYPVSFSPLAANEEVTICISNIKPWWQTGSLDVRMRPIRNKVAPGQNASNGVPASLFFSSTSSSDFSPGSASGGGNNWVVNSEYGYNALSQGKVGKLSFSYLTSGAAGLTIQTHSCSGTCDIPNPGGGSFGAYKTDAAPGSTITLESPGGSIINAVGNKKILLLHDGNVEITDRINVDPGSILIIAASGYIAIGPDTAGPPPENLGVTPSDATTQTHQGIFSAEGSFIVRSRLLAPSDCLSGISDTRINIGGIVIANSALPFANTGGGIFDNRRDLCISNNKLYPSVRVAPRLDFISSFPDELKSKSTLWQEVQP